LPAWLIVNWRAGILSGPATHLITRGFLKKVPF
jgi:hypothetical protein